MGANRKGRIFYLLLAVVVFLLDQASKAMVVYSLPPGITRRVIPGLFNLTHLRNRGAAFGLFADGNSTVVSAFLIGFSVVALVLVVTLLVRGAVSGLGGWGLGLILGGALGNLFDRLRSGSVVDFLDFHLAGYHWPAFNLADSAIVLGALILMLELLRRRRHAPDEV